jgi:hypothetical protein
MTPLDFAAKRDSDSASWTRADPTAALIERVARLDEPRTGLSLCGCRQRRPPHPENPGWLTRVPLRLQSPEGTG